VQATPNPPSFQARRKTQSGSGTGGRPCRKRRCCILKCCCIRVFADITGVSRIVAETREGSFGLLPHRLDCVAGLAPGILIYNRKEAEVYVAVDEGVL